MDRPDRPSSRSCSSPLLKGVDLPRERRAALARAVASCRRGCATTSAVLGLELMLDEAEGYAFLPRGDPASVERVSRELPRLVARRPLGVHR